jgi:hypothetical protein
VAPSLAVCFFFGFGDRRLHNGNTPPCEFVDELSAADVGDHDREIGRSRHASTRASPQRCASRTRSTTSAERASNAILAIIPAAATGRPRRVMDEKRFGSVRSKGRRSALEPLPIVSRLSKKWLRGHATNSIWSSAGRQGSDAFLACAIDHSDISPFESTICGRSG